MHTAHLSIPKILKFFFLLFQSTAEFQSNDDIMQELEKFGGMADCSSFRYFLLNSVYLLAQTMSHLQKLKFVVKTSVFSQQRCHYLWNILFYKWPAHGDESFVSGCFPAPAYRPRGIKLLFSDLNIIWAIKAVYCIEEIKKEVSKFIVQPVSLICVS